MATTTQVTAPSVSTPTNIHLRTKAPINSVMSDTPPPDLQASNAPAHADVLTCKACGRTLATISTNGDLVPHGELDEGCDLCKDMRLHYNEYEEVKVYFKELEHRRENYRPRQLALEVVHEAQMNLGNFIQSVTAWESPGEAEENAPDNEKQPEARENLPPPEATHTPPHRRKRSLSPQSSPGPRLSERSRRVSFEPSVVFRDAEAEETRDYAVFSRNSEGYSPGRYAAPVGSAWLDTSGHGTSDTKFFGIWKKGGKWKPTKEGLELDQEWEDLRNAEDGGGEGGGNELENKPDAGDETPAPDVDTSQGDATTSTDDGHSTEQDKTNNDTQLTTTLNPAPAKQEPSTDDGNPTSTATT